jgi:cytochrome c-type biogenesis protein CcmH
VRAATLFALAVALLAGVGAARAQPPNAADLEAELVCPVCETTLDQSNAPVAERMKAYIRARIAAGDSAQDIRDALVAEFGPGVIARPPEGGFGLLAWLLPLGAVLVGIVVLAALVRSWSRRRTPSDTEAEPLDPALERRVDEELARFDA